MRVASPLRRWHFGAAQKTTCALARWTLDPIAPTELVKRASATAALSDICSRLVFNLLPCKCFIRHEDCELIAAATMELIPLVKVNCTVHHLTNCLFQNLDSHEMASIIGAKLHVYGLFGHIRLGDHHFEVHYSCADRACEAVCLTSEISHGHCLSVKCSWGPDLFGDLQKRHVLLTIWSLTS
jgi:hypothetical protein